MKKIFLVIALLLSVVGLSACTLTPAPDDIINPEADYVYFFGKTCPHCQELNSWMVGDDTHSKYAIEKREVYFNAENGAAFQAVTKALGLEEGAAGVPFMLRKSDNEYRIGVEPIKKLLSGEDVADISTEEAAIYEDESIDNASEEVVEETVTQ